MEGSPWQGSVLNDGAGMQIPEELFQYFNNDFNDMASVPMNYAAEFHPPSSMDRSNTLLAGQGNGDMAVDAPRASGSPSTNASRSSQHTAQGALGTNAGPSGGPAESNAYTLIVGGRVFRLSWQSLCADGPSNFFTDYFSKNKSHVMRIDRDPETFRLVVLHLRGYRVRPVDDTQNNNLLSDARYYGLKQLEQLLRRYLYINVGGRVFCLTWDLLAKDSTPNYFTGPFKEMLEEMRYNDTRPLFIDRDPDNFEDIVRHLRGYTIHIKDELHRKNLLKDAQYYAFKQLADKLLTAHKTVDGFGEQAGLEVLVHLQDVRIAHLLPSRAESMGMQASGTPDHMTDQDWSLTQIQYQRESTLYALLVQIADACLQVHQALDVQTIRVELAKPHVKKLERIARTVKATQGVSQNMIIDDACAITIDDVEVTSLADYVLAKNNWETCTRCPVASRCRLLRLILQRGMCRIHVVQGTVMLSAVRLEMISTRLLQNRKRPFLPL